MTGQEARDDEREALASVIADYQACGSCAGAPPYCRACMEEADAILAAGYRKHPEPEITDAAVEQRAKDMASASGWWWPTLGENGRLGRDGWRERARAELVRGGQA